MEHNSNSEQSEQYTAKRRFKMYKSGKQWMYALIVFVGLAAGIAYGGATQASADTTTNSASVYTARTVASEASSAASSSLTPSQASIATSAAPVSTSPVTSAPSAASTETKVATTTSTAASEATSAVAKPNTVTLSQAPSSSATTKADTTRLDLAKPVDNQKGKITPTTNTQQKSGATTQSALSKDALKVNVANSTVDSGFSPIIYGNSAFSMAAVGDDGQPDSTLAISTNTKRVWVFAINATGARFDGTVIFSDGSRKTSFQYKVITPLSADSPYKKLGFKYGAVVDFGLASGPIAPNSILTISGSNGKYVQATIIPLDGPMSQAFKDANTAASQAANDASTASSAASVAISDSVVASSAASVASSADSISTSASSTASQAASTATSIAASDAASAAQSAANSGVFVVQQYGSLAKSSASLAASYATNASLYASQANSIAVVAQEYKSAADSLMAINPTSVAVQQFESTATNLEKLSQSYASVAVAQDAIALENASLANSAYAVASAAAQGSVQQAQALKVANKYAQKAKIAENISRTAMFNVSSLTGLLGQVNVTPQDVVTAASAAQRAYDDVHALSAVIPTLQRLEQQAEMPTTNDQNGNNSGNNSSHSATTPEKSPSTTVTPKGSTSKKSPVIDKSATVTNKNVTKDQASANILPRTDEKNSETSVLAGIGLTLASIIGLFGLGNRKKIKITNFTK